MLSHIEELWLKIKTLPRACCCSIVRWICDEGLSRRWALGPYERRACMYDTPGLLCLLP